MINFPEEMAVVRNNRLLQSLMLAISGVLAPMSARGQGVEGTPVVPGLTIYINQGPRRDTVVYQRTITRNGQDSSAGVRTVVTRAVLDRPGAHLVEIEQRFPAGPGVIVDTAIDELHTMRAVAHSSHQPTRTMRFDFNGSTAVGTVALKRESGDSVFNVLQDVGGPIFDSNVIDLVVGELPLAPGYEATLPFFIYERGGRVMMPVKVRERSSVPFGKLGRRDAWVVDVGIPGAPATMWIDAEAHTLLRVRFDIAARGMVLTDERITPLRG
jgi:hypothetical protein